MSRGERNTGDCISWAILMSKQLWEKHQTWRLSSCLIQASCHLPTTSSQTIHFNSNKQVPFFFSLLGCLPVSSDYLFDGSDSANARTRTLLIGNVFPHPTPMQPMTSTALPVALYASTRTEMLSTYGQARSPSASSERFAPFMIILYRPPVVLSVSVSTPSLMIRSSCGHQSIP